MNDARAEVQYRYEAPIAAAFITSAMMIFTTSIGLMFRKNWARLPMITVVAVAMLEVALVILLFWSLRMLDVLDYVANLVTITVLGVVAWKLHTPSVVSEFSNATPRACERPACRDDAVQADGIPSPLSCPETVFCRFSLPALSTL
jgi:hypothetical protein